MNSYIVRIYREEKNNPRNFVGTVEEVGAEEKKAFTTFEDLWAIFNSRANEARDTKTFHAPRVKGKTRRATIKPGKE